LCNNSNYVVIHLRNIPAWFSIEVFGEVLV
jgi:hypothetical protein